MKISVVGGGYVGLVTGTCLAQLGHDVTIIEINAEKVRVINNGQSSIYEIGLEVLLTQNTGKKLHTCSAFDTIASADIVFICVGTPPKPDGNADLSSIKSASSSIGTALKNNRSYCCVVVKSTVPPGTTEKIVQPSVLMASGNSENEIGFAINPEFLREGRAIEDFLHPDRIVIGSNDPRAGKHIDEVYQGISAPVIQTGLTAAEMIKYTSNAFLATKISFANEIGNICKHLGIDVYEVMKGVGYDPRIDPMFLNAGAGFGGNYLPKDVSSLVSLAKEIGENPVLLQSVLAVNKQQPHQMVALLLEKIGTISGKQIAILGLAFKDNTDDIRDSCAITVIRELLQKRVHVSAYDPMAVSNMKQHFPGIEYCSLPADALAGSDGCLVMTKWQEFSRLDNEFDLMAHRIIIEGRRILTCKEADGICW